MSEVYDPRKSSVIYLRPGLRTRPIRYHKAIEQQGMIVDAKHGIAMYTSRAGMAVGPAGPMPDVLDTIIASCSDEDTPILVGGPKTTFRAPYPLDLSYGYVRISLTNAPVGAAFIVDLHMNGATIFSTLVQIDSGTKTSVGSVQAAVLSVTDVPDDAEFTVYVTQTGTTTAGTGLKIAVIGKKV